MVVHKKDGADAAKTCEERCGKEAGCIGYLTEDGSKCQLIPGTTYGGSATTITGVDSEKKNYCWRKGKGAGSNRQKKCNTVRVRDAHDVKVASEVCVVITFREAQTFAFMIMSVL